MKADEELNALKEKVRELNRKLTELTGIDLQQGRRRFYPSLRSHGSRFQKIHRQGRQ